MKYCNDNYQRGEGDLWFLVWVGLGMWFLLAVFLAVRPDGGDPPSIPAEAVNELFKMEGRVQQDGLSASRKPLNENAHRKH